MFLNLNNEERLLRQELADKQSELAGKEKNLKRSKAIHANNIRNLKKKERQHFIGSFAQAKNLIDKQMALGMLLKERTHTKKENRKKVQAVKHDLKAQR